MSNYDDLLITDNDLTFSNSDVVQETYITDRGSIAQDIVHMIRETGLLIDIVGQRNEESVQINLKRIEQKIEDDIRIVPGTAKITRLDLETMYITATTVEYGEFKVYL